MNDRHRDFHVVEGEIRVHSLDTFNEMKDIAPDVGSNVSINHRAGLADPINFEKPLVWSEPLDDRAHQGQTPLV